MGAMFRLSIEALLEVLGQATQRPAGCLLEGADGKVTVLLQRQLMQLIVHRRHRCRFLWRLFVDELAPFAPQKAIRWRRDLASEGWA